MAEFCECGSLVIEDRCTNKNCAFRAATKPTPTKRKSTAKAKATGVTGLSLEATKPAPVKAGNPRRASKCVTYNLYDTENEKDEASES